MQGRRPRSGHGCGSRERRSRRSGRRTRSTPVPPGSPRGGSKYWDDFVVSGASEPEPPPPEPDPEPVSLVTEVVGDGTVVVDPVQEQYVAGDVVALTATPGDGQLFVGWSGDVSGSENPLTVTLAGDGDATTADTTTVTATFEPEPPPPDPEPDPEPVSLVTDVVGDGTVVVDPVLEQYVAGDVVALTATPGDGQLFVGWSGDVSGSENPLTITLAADGDATTADTTTVIATFEPEPPPPEPDPEPVSLVTEVVGDGAVVVDPVQDQYVAGDVVALTATPGDGQLFVGWSGDVSGSENPLTVTLAADGDATTADTTTVIATFESEPPPEPDPEPVSLVTEVVG